MKKKIFDRGLFCEGILQLKLPGIIISIISILGSVLPAVFFWSNLNSKLNLSLIVEIKDIALIVLPEVYIVPIIFCLVLFYFLDSRKGSDYYHSLPKSRVSLFINYTLAIFVWLAGIIVVSVLAASFVYSIAGGIFNAAAVPYLIFSYLAAAVLVAASMLLAMSITGTILSNFIVFMLILFLPNFIGFLFTYCVANSLPIVNAAQGGIGGIKYNLPCAFICNRHFGIDFFNQNEILTYLPSIICTFVIAAVYIALALLFFRLRKSETAGKSAPNRVLQNIYRCVVTLPVALIIPVVLENDSFNIYHRTEYQVIIVAGIIAIFIYFLFELITTKSLKKMFRCAPMLLAVAAVCTIFGISLHYTQQSIVDFTPKGSEIDSVSFLPNDVEHMSFFDYNCKNLGYKDDLISNTVSNTLKSNVNALKAKNFDTASSNAKTYFVKIKLKNGVEIQRIIYAQKSQQTVISDGLADNADYKKCIATLPSDKSIQDIHTDDTSGTNFLTDPQTKKLWECYKSEFKMLSSGEQQAATTSFSELAIDNCVTCFAVVGNIGKDSYYSGYVITSKTPKTANLYFDMVNAKSKPVFDNLFSSDNTFSNGGSFSIDSYKGVSNKLSYGDLCDRPLAKNYESAYTKLFSILKEDIGKPIDLSKPFIRLRYQSKLNNTSIFYMPISSENTDKIKGLHMAG